MHRIQKHPRVMAMLPALSSDERELLTADIIANGCRDPLLICSNPDDPADPEIIIDGNNRYEICSINEISYQISQIDLPDWESIELYVLNTQLSRRNLTDTQRSYYRGKRYNLEKRGPGNPQFRDEETAGSTAERIAFESGVSPRTIKRDAVFADAVDELPEAERAAVLSGQQSISKQQLVAMRLDRETADSIIEQGKFLPIIASLKTISEHVGERDPSTVATEFCETYPIEIEKYRYMITAHFDKAVNFLNLLQHQWSEHGHD